VTAYDERQDEVRFLVTEDDDYPHTPFICFPRIKMIACVDSSKMPANTAMSRLHRILAHRKRMLFIFKPVSQSFDLRKATNRFRVTQVDFEILPVNPHTGDLGRVLDESKKLDHIQKLKGKAEAKPNDSLKLCGGFLTAVQELQQSGHGRVGFTAFTEKGVEVQVNKPGNARELADDPEEQTWGEEADVRVVLRGRREEYPFAKEHVLEMLQVAKKFVDSDVHGT